MTIDEIEEILVDGDADSISTLPHGVQYSYCPEYDSMTVSYQNVFSKGRGYISTPNCVSVFGNSHTF